MRTALITVGDKQQIVLQPENVREHRILQMLFSGAMDIRVMESPVSVTAEGSLEAVKAQQFYQDPSSANPKLVPVMVQVQPDMPAPKPMRNPEVLITTKSELHQAMSAIFSKPQTLPLELACGQLFEMLTGNPEPSPYL